MHLFDHATAVQRTGPSTWAAQVSDQWSIGGNPNGGYLTSIVVSAMRELTDHADPVTLTTHFLRPGTGDAPAEVHAEVVRAGRTLTTVRGSLAQEGRDRLAVLGALGTIENAPGGVAIDIERPTIAPPESCVPRDGASQGVDLALMNSVEMVLPPDRQLGGGGPAETAGWIRFRDDRPVDTAALVLFTDAFPPSIFGMLGRVGWVPTVEMTIHVRRRPASGWIQGRFRTTDLSGDRLVEDGCLWDSEGALVAQIRQIAMMLP